jgi:hypothetical protein
MGSKILLSFATILSLLTQPAHASVNIPTEQQRRDEARAQFKNWLVETSIQARHPFFEMDFLINEHQTFASRDEAIQWASNLLPRLQKSFDDPTLKILRNDPRYAVLDKYVQELWEAFTALFPTQTAGLNSPPVILLETKSSNAFVHSSEDGKQMVHAIFVFTGLLDLFFENGRLNKDLITAVIGHELAHSVFLHGLPKYQKRTNHFFNRSKIDFGYKSSQSPDTATLDQAMASWLTGAFLTGEITSDELNDLPSPSVGRTLMMSSFKQMQTEAIDNSCPMGKLAYQIWSGKFLSSALKNSIEIAPEEQRPPGNATPSSMRQASQELSRQDRLCLGNKKISLLELAAKAFGIPVEKLRQSEAFMTLEQTFTSSPDPISGFQQVIAPIRATMQKIESTVNFNQLGYYTYEEHADEVSALLHTYLNRKADALGNAFLIFLKDSSDADAENCARMIASQSEPQGGSFNDPHRSLCYRMYHLGQFSKTFGKDIKAFASEFINVSIGITALDQGPIGAITRGIR